MPPEQTHPTDAGGVPAQVVDADVAAGVVTAAGVVAVDGMTHNPLSHTKSSLG